MTPEPDTTTWLKVEVDEDGNIVVHDLVEGTKSAPIASVMRTPTDYVNDIHEAIVGLMRDAGMDI